jgi:hypothetical protein
VVAEKDDLAQKLLLLFLPNALFIINRIKNLEWMIFSAMANKDTPIVSG